MSARNQRSEPRWLRTESASVQLTQPNPDGSPSHRVVNAHTIEVSERGLRLWLDQAVEQGRLFDICIELQHHPRRFLLIGETRWCRWEADSNGYEVGVEIQNSEDTDAQVWAHTIHDLQKGN